MSTKINEPVPRKVKIAVRCLWMIVGGASVVAAPLLLAPLKYHSATGLFIVAIAILLILVLSIFPYGFSH